MALTRLVSDVLAELEATPVFVRSQSEQTNIGVSRTTFVGRERELRELRELLRSDGERLVTLTGPPVILDVVSRILARYDIFSGWGDARFGVRSDSGRPLRQ